MDYQFIQNLITNLRSTLNWFDSFSNDGKPWEEIPAADQATIVCEMIRSLQKQFNRSFVFPKLIEAEAFRFALDQSGNFKDIKCIPIWPKRMKHLDYADYSKAKAFAIQASIERYTMDGTGYHVGYETVTFQWIAIKKDSINNAGIPKFLSNWLINPDVYEIIKKDYPPEDKPVHDDDCKYRKSKSFNNCNCADLFEGYTHPDDDFFYQECDHYLDQLVIPEPQFNPANREWSLGDITYSMDDFQNDPEYAESVKLDDGAPYVD